jgi:SulP family sulfate permease
LLDRGAWLSERSTSHQFPVEFFFNASHPPSFSGQLPKFVNSASEHGEQSNLLDWILVSMCLVLPMIIYGIVRFGEGLDARSTCPPEPRRGKRPRIGSLYRLLEQERGSMTPVGCLMQAFDSDMVEGTILQNVLSGFTVALAMIPNVVSFSFITETSPANGLWACALMSISASLVGGRPGMVSGVSAATATVLSSVSTPDDMGGMAPMALCVFSAGLLQILFGSLRISKLVTLIPHPVMLGFVNGIALVMLRSQLRHLHEYGDGPWVSYGTFVGMMVVGGIAMFVAMAWRKVPKFGTAVPSALASLVITTALSFVVSTRTIGDIAGPGMLDVGFGQVPKWDFPPVGMEWSNHKLVFKTLSLSFRLAFVGLLESLLTEALIDQITGTTGSMRRECFGQGVGNVIAALFGTQGGCGLLGHSLLNVSSGGRSRLSSVIAGFTLILCATVLSPLVALIPVAGVMGILVLIALNTFAWGMFKLVLRVNWVDSVVVIVVMLITVWYDVAVAVFIGVVVHALGFAWTIATEARVETEAGPDTRTFYLIGPLFFGSAGNYRKEISPQMIVESNVVLDFSKCRILDIAGVDAVKKMRDLLVSQNKQVSLKGIPRDVLPFLPKDTVCEVLRPKGIALEV